VTSCRAPVRCRDSAHGSFDKFDILNTQHNELVQNEYEVLLELELPSDVTLTDALMLCMSLVLCNLVT